MSPHSHAIQVYHAFKEVIAHCTPLITRHRASTERSAHRSACNLGYMAPESDRSSAREHFSYMAAHRPAGAGTGAVTGTGAERRTRLGAPPGAAQDSPEMLSSSHYRLMPHAALHSSCGSSRVPPAAVRAARASRRALRAGRGRASRPGSCCSCQPPAGHGAVRMGGVRRWWIPGVEPRDA